jgi:hypothetical protein
LDSDLANPSTSRLLLFDALTLVVLLPPALLFSGKAVKSCAYFVVGVVGVSSSNDLSNEVLGRAKSACAPSAMHWCGGVARVLLRECAMRRRVEGDVLGTAKSDGSADEEEEGHEEAERTMPESALLSVALLNLVLRRASIKSSSITAAKPSTAPRNSSSHDSHTLDPNLGTTLPPHCSCAHVASPGVFALSGVTHSSIGLLIFAHSERLAKSTRFDAIGDSERDGRASGPPPSFLDF